MEELTIDTGLKTYRINGGAALVFNPADPNLYHRFLQLGERLEAVQNELAEKTAAAKTGTDALALLAAADESTKQALNEAFGPPNDFNRALQGVNLMAVCQNGQRAITNLLGTLTPILEKGAAAFYESAAAPDLAKARAERAARGDEEPITQQTPAWEGGKAKPAPQSAPALPQQGQTTPGEGSHE